MTTPLVPNIFPTLAFNGIALIGEAPGKDEVATLIPFVGQSGRALNDVLSQAGIVRDSCYIGNVCGYQPPSNQIAAFEWEEDQIQSGIARLTTDLTKLKPNLVVLLGSTPLHLFLEGNFLVGKRRTDEGWQFSFPNKVLNWRGSQFLAHSCSPLPGVKCIATVHPAFCVRSYEWMPMLMMDLVRAKRSAASPELILPHRNLITNPTFEELISFISYIRRERPTCGMDIEGSYKYLPCFSIADTPEHAMIVPFAYKDGRSVWSEDQELILLHHAACLLADPKVPKIWQNGLYDRWSLQYGHDIPVFGNADDIMPKWWERYCELKKSLATQVSILTDEPYYKGDIKSQDDQTFFRYCCRDSAVTKEINNKLEVLLPRFGPKDTAGNPLSMQHYRHNHNLINLFLYPELRGMRYDKALAKSMLHQVEQEVYREQEKLDTLSGMFPWPETPEERLLLVYDTCAYKKDHTKPKADFVESFEQLKAIAVAPTTTPEQRGFFSMEMGVGLNNKSDDFKDYLYNTLKLPIQYSKKVTEDEDGEETQAETADYLALVKLRKLKPNPILDVAIALSALRQRAQMLRLTTDPDGRIRSSYNNVGTKTGRISSRKSPTGSGHNLQTIPDDDKSYPKGHAMREGMRRLILADPDHWLFQCDLKGSDGWTIGAHLNILGAPMMLQDLRFGIKPAQRIAYTLLNGNAALKNMSLQEVYNLVNTIDKDNYIYKLCKIGIWGICYLMGVDTLIDNINKQSGGEIQTSRDEIAKFRRSVMDTYLIELLHNSLSRKLAANPMLTSASGHTRRFYGRKGDVLGEALADEPQQNTTYATNKAAERLWDDPENRTDRLLYTEKGKILRIPFIVEPLHQVHDALIGQFPKDKTSWAIPKIHEWFNNPLIIAGQRIVIPFEGNYGPSWGEQPYKLVL